MTLLKFKRRETGKNSSPAKCYNDSTKVNDEHALFIKKNV